jgi:putative colanic acid biosynthesis acetyltransferase WcaB
MADTGSLRGIIRQDLAANRGNMKGQLIVTAFRIAHHLRSAGAGDRPPLWAVPGLALYRIVVDWLLGVEIPPLVRAGARLQVVHGTALVLHSDVRLGSDVRLRHSTTIGALGDGVEGVAPTLGDGVDVGAGAIVLGPIVIGDGARIGAGSVVLDDVPAGATVAGNPARIIVARNQRG